MKAVFVYPKMGGIFPRMPINLSINPPLGIMYLGAICRENGIDTELIDLTFDNKWSAFEKRIERSGADVVGFTALSPFYDDVLKAVEITRKVTNAKILIGGPHATAVPMEVIKDSDIVVIGEAEKTIIPLLRALENHDDLNTVNGVVFKRDGFIVFTGEPERPDVDELPLPARDMLPTIKKYFRQIPLFPNVPPVGIVLASRGCPFNCSFCQPMLNRIYGKKVRFRSPQNILAEIDELVRVYKIRTLMFSDDNLTVNKKWLAELCDGLEERNYDLIIGAQGKADTFTPETAERLKRINCRSVAFGVESGCQRILDDVMDKKITLDDIRTAFDLCEKNDILSLASLMIGSPGDDRESMLDTVKLIKEIRPNFIDLHYTAPTPGTRMYQTEFDKSHKDRWSVGGSKELADIFHKIQLIYRKVKKRPPVKYLRDYVCGNFRFCYNFFSFAAQGAYFCLDNSVLMYRLLGKWVFSLKGD